MQKTDTSLFIVLLLVLGGLYLLRPARVAKPRGPAPAVAGTVAQSPTLQKIEKTIDENMKIGRSTQELRRDLTAIENSQAPLVDMSKLDPSTFDPAAPLPLKLNAEDAAGRAFQLEVENRNKARGALSPEQRINNKINRDQWEREYREAYEREYLRAYVENARKAGYDVKLNSEGDIVEVTTIGTEEPVRFPQSVDESDKKPTFIFHKPTFETDK
jgi:hypothetical protein